MDENLSHELGYVLYPPRRPSEPGYARLEVHLLDRPSQHHFDPDQVHVSVASADGGLELLKITHPWIGPSNWHLCVGQIDLLDRKGKHVDLFTFGGSLYIERVNEAGTHLAFSSDAPFLLAQAHLSVTNLLIQEVEIELAHLRAAWCRQQEDFANCLACVDPFDLYRMCLAAILERIEQLEYEETVFRLRHVLLDELAAIGFPALSLHDLRA